MGRKGLPIPEVEFVPHHFYPLFRVHGQKGALNPGHVPLVHLGGKDVCPDTHRPRVCTWSLPQPSPNHECVASPAQLSGKAGEGEAGNLEPRGERGVVQGLGQKVKQVLEVGDDTQRGSGGSKRHVEVVLG